MPSRGSDNVTWMGRAIEFRPTPVLYMSRVGDPNDWDFLEGESVMSLNESALIDIENEIQRLEENQTLPSLLKLRTIGELRQNHFKIWTEIQEEKKRTPIPAQPYEEVREGIPPQDTQARLDKAAQLRNRKRIGCECAECTELENLAIGLEKGHLTVKRDIEAVNEPKQVQNVLRTLPSKAEDRKLHPILSGCVDYFPLALAAIARISKAGNDQHNPGQPLHWARGKSTDHGDCILRHLIERGTIDTDGMRHSAKMAWRALALLQEELEAEAGWTPKE